ncbi:MAG: hypothetical protein K8R02_03100 [Anaerohalosphaeraceae bacterium]|nr:hypothetical protein [Anaerohalosphaeraceae bacterium]
MDCTITKHLKIVPAKLADYKCLAHFHYRSSKLGPIAAMYKLIDTHPRRAAIEPIIGVIIYSMPPGQVQMRNVATSGLFTGLKRMPAMTLVNKNVRTISRVVIEPRYRCLGLAHRLVAETLALLEMPYIEAMAVMGKVNPFFEKAGMLKFAAPEHTASVKLRQALSVIDIEAKDLVDVELIERKLAGASGAAGDFVEKHIADFLSAYGRRGRTIPAGRERVEMMLEKLGSRPVYYLWRNPNVKFGI